MKDVQNGENDMKSELRLKIIQRLKDKRSELNVILAEYNIHKIRIWGLPETDCVGEPDVDILVGFDDFDKARPVLICFRNQFIRKIRKHNSHDLDYGILLCERVSAILGYDTEGCQELGLKNFYPLTYEHTLDRGWKPEKL